MKAGRGPCVPRRSLVARNAADHTEAPACVAPPSVPRATEGVDVVTDVLLANSEQVSDDLGAPPHYAWWRFDGGVAAVRRKRQFNRDCSVGDDAATHDGPDLCVLQAKAPKHQL